MINLKFVVQSVTNDISMNFLCMDMDVFCAVLFNLVIFGYVKSVTQSFSNSTVFGERLSGSEQAPNKNPFREKRICKTRQTPLKAQCVYRHINMNSI